MNTKRLIDTFCEFVKIPSESPDDRKFISYLEKLFKKEGAKTTLDSFGNLIAKFDAKNSNSTEPVAFSCHADTVKPGVGIEPVIKDGIIKSKGDTILGADDKAGIAEIVEMLRSSEKHPPLEIIITRCEEINPSGVAHLDYSLIDSKIAYVIDMDSPEEVVVGGPTYIILHVMYKGKTAHAGISPEKGISAVQAASLAISRLRLGRLDEESTANVGIIKGGENINSIPDRTEIFAECRSLNHKKAIAIAEEMKAVFNRASEEYGTKVDVETCVDLEAYRIPADSKVVSLVVEALKQNGIEADVKVVMGGTDATHFNANAVETVVLGIGAREMHSTNEHAIISEMEATTKTIIKLVENLA